MSQFLGFGNGSDAAATLSGTDAPIDSSCSGTAAATTLSATNASFAANQIIMIHQSRGTGVGAWELNQISSYVAGTITLALPLVNTYTDSGASQAQVLVVEQHSQITVSGTLTAKAWDGNVGGILALMCNGKVTISGTLTTGGPGPGGGYSTLATGYRGELSVSSQDGVQGEGTIGAGGTISTAANGSGGGGSSGGTTENRSGGGGGGNSAAGGTGTGSGGTGGTGGTSAGASDLTTMVFGGAGGAGAAATAAGHSGYGGAIICIFAKEIEVTGTIKSDGTDGQVGGSASGPGGAGAGGSVFIKAQTATLGTNLVLARGGVGPTGGGGDAGDGADGRIRIEACSRTGTTNPSASESIGGHDFCASPGGIF